MGIRVIVRDHEGQLMFYKTLYFRPHNNGSLGSLDTSGIYYLIEIWFYNSWRCVTNSAGSEEGRKKVGVSKDN
jgi:hypothetical protein